MYWEYVLIILEIIDYLDVSLKLRLCTSLDENHDELIIIAKVHSKPAEKDLHTLCWKRIYHHRERSYDCQQLHIHSAIMPTRFDPAQSKVQRNCDRRD